LRRIRGGIQYEPGPVRECISGTWSHERTNAVEIEQAVSLLAEQAFDATELPFAFLLAFGNKETTIKRLRAGASNKSDLGGVPQTNHIHIAVYPPGETTKMLTALKASHKRLEQFSKPRMRANGALIAGHNLTQLAENQGWSL
jgi:hypothetical protein